jgi:hypothetical protein
LTQKLFRKARFDWTGKTLSKLVEFARQGHLHLLTTEVTKGEVTSQLRELLADVDASVKKHEIVLQQAGAGEALTTIAGTDRAIAALDAAFEKFLKDTKAIDVPLSADLNALFGDYFAPWPPVQREEKIRIPGRRHYCMAFSVVRKKARHGVCRCPAIPILKHAVRHRGRFSMPLQWAASFPRLRFPGSCMRPSNSLM